jgi:hypothetical protein
MTLLAISTLIPVLTSAKGGKGKKVGKTSKTGSDACFNIYELSASGTFNGYTFAGVTDEGMFSTPLFYSSDPEGEVAGRV